MNRGSIIRGLLALSVPGVGLIASCVGVAAGCQVCVTSQPVAWAIMSSPAVVMAGLLWIVLTPVVERPPAKPAAAARHRRYHAAAATAS